MFGRVGVLEILVVPVIVLAAIGPTRFGMMVAYAAGYAAGSP